jgi:hypothetical protein
MSASLHQAFPGVSQYEIIFPVTFLLFRLCQLADQSGTCPSRYRIQSDQTFTSHMHYSRGLSIALSCRSPTRGGSDRLPTVHLDHAFQESARMTVAISSTFHGRESWLQAVRACPFAPRAVRGMPNSIIWPRRSKDTRWLIWSCCQRRNGEPDGFVFCRIMTNCCPLASRFHGLLCKTEPDLTPSNRSLAFFVIYTA